MRYKYEGYFKCESQCDLDIYRYDEGVVVVATEIDENEGTSVTNMAEGLATVVCKDWGIDPQTLIWIEHYPDRDPSGRKREDPIWAESFDIVFFDWDGKRFRRPKWQRLTAATAASLIGGDFSVQDLIETPVRGGDIFGEVKKWHAKQKGDDKDDGQGN